MKVARWYSNSDIRIEEVADPLPGAREMVVRVISCGICGSDVVEWYRLPRAPLVQGHEIGAEVVTVGSSVSNFKPGDRVFIAPKVPCHECRYCLEGHHPVCSAVKDRLPGGFAQYILVPEDLVEKGAYLLPESISFDQSTFIEPLACVARAQDLAGLEPGQIILVMGCGTSGQLHIKLAHARKCTIYATDVNNHRLGIAKNNGADFTIDATKDVLKILHTELGRMADVVMVCTSSVRAVEQAWKCVDSGGAIVFFAVPGPKINVTIPLSKLWTREIRILTSYYCAPQDIRYAIDLIAAGEVAVDDLITHRLSLDDTATGFALGLQGTESMKVIIKPNGE
jgi:L-iditol 2-dehydrogenase